MSVLRPPRNDGGETVCYRAKPSSGRKVDFCRRQKDGRSRRRMSCISAMLAFSQSLTRCRQGGTWNYALPQSKPAVLPAPSRREPWQYVLFVKGRRIPTSVLWTSSQVTEAGCLFPLSVFTFGEATSPLKGRGWAECFNFMPNICNLLLIEL